MARERVAGVIWQTMHYLVGLQRLGYDVYYVEAHARAPKWFSYAEGDPDGSLGEAAFLDGVMRRFDLTGCWAYQALHSDGRSYGLSERALRDLYRDADLIINLSGATLPRPEHVATGRLVYLETDPVRVQIELANNVQETADFLDQHCRYFTFGENYGTADCPLPAMERYPFLPTRQPIVADLWDPCGRQRGEAYTTIGNWRQVDRDLEFRGEVYGWSKHAEFTKVLDLPRRTGQTFELSLTRYDEGDVQILLEHGWHVRPSLDFSLDIDQYRDYIAGSRGEFTVAKDQNIRLHSGWFSDRSATYLAAGRPVINQETGFSRILPTGKGLFAFSDLDEAVAAVEQIEADYPRNAAAAAAIAREYFNYDVVLPPLLAASGV